MTEAGNIAVRHQQKSLHLVAYISAHGFGHIAQTAPILNALRQRLPKLRLTIISVAPEFKLQERIEGDFRLEARALDFGFIMEDAFAIDRAQSAEAYRAFHADWEAGVEQEANKLAELKPRLVLANAAYLPLAAAKRCGIPAFGMSSLNWADLFAFTFAGESWADAIHAQMLEAYRSADAFIRLEPAMDMPSLGNTVQVRPVARLGKKRTPELRQQLGVDKKIVLMAFGGIDSGLRPQNWQEHGEIHWLIPQAWGCQHPATTPFEALGWNFTDLLASVDAVITKPGYGTFTEAACTGTPLLYARRPAWPEQDALIDWITAQAKAAEIETSALHDARALGHHLQSLWRLPDKPLPQPSGVEDALDLLLQKLEAGKRGNDPLSA